MLRSFLILIALIVISGAVAIVGLQAPTDWQPAESIRTPESRFANIPDYPFSPNYTELSGYRVHYVDEGPRDAPVVLLLHGQPSWSYLYRHMIPPLAAAGYRVVAPDLVGFGKSDKPLEQSDHSYQMHIDLMTDLVRRLDLKRITFFGQDWGGLIGLRVVANEPDRFSHIMLSNTGLPAAEGIGGWVGYPLFRLAVWREGTPTLQDLQEDFGFARWVAYAKTTKDFDFAGLFQSSTTRALSAEELAAYAAPFPDEPYLAAPHIFPYLVPSQLRQNAAVMRDVFAKWDKPFLTAFGDSDPVTVGGEKIWQETVPGAADQPHTIIKNAAHFIQEDQPKQLVQLMIALMESR